MCGSTRERASEGASPSVDRPQCEEVTSTDPSSYEGGKNVTVTQYDDYVSFQKKKGLIAENNVG